jgi:hypothetical protein
MRQAPSAKRSRLNLNLNLNLNCQLSVEWQVSSVTNC